MVDSLGGITVDVPEPISDPNSKIYFDTGCQTLDGEQALDYVRVRHGVGNGSDLGRIERQQQFLAAVDAAGDVQGHAAQSRDAVRSSSTRPPRSVTTDTGIGSIQAMAGIAVRARAVGLNNINFTTVPVEAWPQDPNRVQWQQPAADDLWESLASDTSLTPVEAEPVGRAHERRDAVGADRGDRRLVGQRICQSEHLGPDRRHAGVQRFLTVRADWGPEISRPRPATPRAATRVRS